MDTVSGLAQIVFWIVVGTVTVLTFSRASKTILQPLRTEVFKLQLERMREVLALFVGRSEMKLREDAHFQELFEANFIRLLDSYAETFFPIEIDKEARPYSGIRNFLVKPESIVVANDHVVFPKSEPLNQEEARARRKAEWPGAPADMIAIPDGLVEYTDRVRSILEEPLLPSECASLLEAYLAEIEGVISSTVGKVLIWVAPQLPEKYPELDDLRAATDYWAHAYWVENLKDLKPHADKIAKFARAYFKADEFAPKGVL
ncbi:hypothetical protein [Nocardioides sp. NPDC006273]|uniref:hypothetical protein n=1 Tax=Nocardioides sp. NPDC006273 TaxID=3155598 RepID=UPI0033BD7542